VLPAEAAGAPRASRHAARPLKVDLRTLIAAAAGAAVVALALGLILEGDDPPPDAGPEIAVAAAGLAADARLGWDPSRREELEERAATGTSHVIYALSPGGVIASAERTAAWRPSVERAAARHGVDADRLEAMVFLESAGRPEVIAGETPEAASGLAQITPSAATDLLRMRVDLDRSVALTRAIARAKERGLGARAASFERRRARVDERFVPRLALDGAARYLEIAEAHFGAADLATVSYHMGIGNLESVIRAYVGEGSESRPIGEIVAREDLTYAQLYFDSAPDRNAGAYELLAGFGDDSAEYFWRILASQRIMELWRTDSADLERTVELATSKATLEEVYHPESETPTFSGPDDVEEALAFGDLVPLPASNELAWKIHPRMGELATRLDREPALYRALRPEALATLTYMAARVRELSGAERGLWVTSTVRDREYQDLLRASNPEATGEYSLHTTGWSFDILRRYESDAQAAAFQFMLDRLQALAVIDYAVEPAVIHVTVSELGSALLPD
jgi:Transglycosylase SLT domain